MKSKYLKIFLIPLLSIASIVSCSQNNEEKKEDDEKVDPTPKPEEEKTSFDRLVDNVEHLGFVTGDEAPGKTTDFDVGGTDLGYPLYVKELKKTYFFFGDTFTKNQTGNWRSNVVGISEDDNLSDGLTLSSFISSSAGYTTFAINGHHDRNGVNEVTKIPTGVIDVDGILYMYYFSMWNWNAANDNMMNYGGCVKSTNFGKTWERIYDLTWINPESGNTKENITGLINETAYNVKNGGNILYEDHIGFDATQICPVDGKDGYIYLFLEGGYRNHGPKVARVLKEKIEIFEEYEYFIGKYDENNNPQFRKGKQGLAYIRGKSSTELVSNPFGEMSAFYNSYLKKWCIMTATGNSVMMFMSKNIIGPYNSRCMLFPGSSKVVPVGSIYAPLSIEEMQEEGGKIMYLLTSTWLPYYNPSFIKVTFK
jgi:hypothetical protein